MNAKSCFFFFILFLGVSFQSCRKDFDEINTNPESFTTATDGSLFNAIMASMSYGNNERFYIHAELLYPETQLGALTKNAWSTYTLGTDEMWNAYYSTLPNFRELERRLNEAESSAEINNMKAMVKIMLALKTLRMTDMFGDIPFFEAGYGYISSENLHPKFDSQESIYRFLMDELKWCEDNINESAINDPFQTFAFFDNLFNGNMADWRRFANSLRMRYAMRMVNKDPAYAGVVIADIMDNNRSVVGLSPADTSNMDEMCVAIWPNKLNYTEGWWEYYEHKNLRMGTNVWHQFSENDSADGSGIFDPRVYYFFETNNASEWAPFSQTLTPGTTPDGGVPYGWQRAQGASFHVKGNGCLNSPFNYFMVSDGSNCPRPLISGAEVRFLRAEAYLRGIGVAQNSALAQVEYEEGIKLSLAFWKFVAEHLTLSDGTSFSSKIPVPSNLNYNSVIAHMGFETVSTDEEKLRLIYTQCWIDMLRTVDQAFALCRRTMMTPREGGLLNYYRMPIPASEVAYNNSNYLLAYPGGLDVFQTKLWWMN